MPEMAKPQNPYAKQMADIFEQIAREEAEKTGFSIANEPHGLARMIAKVMSDKSQWTEALNCLRRTN